MSELSYRERQPVRSLQTWKDRVTLKQISATTLVVLSPVPYLIIFGVIPKSFLLVLFSAPILVVHSIFAFFLIVSTIGNFTANWNKPVSEWRWITDFSDKE